MRTFSLIWSGIGCFATVAITVLGGVILNNTNVEKVRGEYMNYNSIEEVFEKYIATSYPIVDTTSDTLLGTDGAYHKITVIQHEPTLELFLWNQWDQWSRFRNIPFVKDYEEYLTVWEGMVGRWLGDFNQSVVWSNFSDILQDYDKNSLSYGDIVFFFQHVTKDYYGPDGTLYPAGTLAFNYEATTYNSINNEAEPEKIIARSILYYPYAYSSFLFGGRGYYGDLISRSGAAVCDPWYYEGEGWYAPDSYYSKRWFLHNRSGKYIGNTTNGAYIRHAYQDYNNVAVFTNSFYYVKGYEGVYSGNRRMNYAIVQHDFLVCIESGEPEITARISLDE
jgi:hypothetical protein